MGRKHELCTFWCESRMFALDITRMREVVRYEDPTTVPLSGEDIRGLVSFRGQIVPVIDLGLRLGLPPKQKERLPINLIVEMPDTPVALTVDSVEDVITIDEDDIQPPPENLKDIERAFIAGVCKAPERLIVILNADAVIDAMGHFRRLVPAER